MPKCNPVRDEFIRDLMRQGYTESAASYHWLQYKNGKKTRRLTYKPVTRGMLDLNGIVINHSLVSEYCWEVIQVDDNGKEKVLKPYLQNDHVMYSIYGFRTEDDNHKEQFSLSLAALLWAYFRTDIPVGYVIDHIDEDPLNNELYNLECVTRSENTRRKTKKNNQYCKGRAGK